MHLSTTVPAHTMVEITLVGSVMNILKTHTDLSKTDTVSREGIVRILPTNEVFVTSKYPIHKVFWAGFSLNNMMKPLIAFYVARSFFSGSTNQHSGIAFNEILVNEGDAWNPVKHYFKVPENGVYIFSASMVLLKNAIASCATISLHKNFEIMKRVKSGITDLMTSGEDLLTLSHLTLLKTKDEIFVTAQAYNELKHLQISLSGFFYSPQAMQRVRSYHYYFKC